MYEISLRFGSVELLMLAIFRDIIALQEVISVHLTRWPWEFRRAHVWTRGFNDRLRSSNIPHRNVPATYGVEICHAKDSYSFRKRVPFGRKGS